MSTESPTPSPEEAGGVVIQETAGGEKALVIPLKGVEVSTLISDLLRQQQRTSGVEKGSFTFSKHDLLDIREALLQRVSQQNGSTVVNERYFLEFADGEEFVKLNSVEAFRAYADSASRAVTSLRASISLLTRFPDQATPTKQLVSFGAHAWQDWDAPRILRSMPDGAVLAFEIEASARTWSEDVSLLLRKRLKQRVDSIAPMRSWASKYSLHIGAAVTACLAIYGVVQVLRHRPQWKEDLLQDWVPDGATETQIEFVAQATQQGLQDAPQHLDVALVLVLVTSTVAGVALAMLLQVEHRGHISISAACDERIKAAKSRAKRTASKFVLTAVVSGGLTAVGRELVAALM